MRCTNSGLLKGHLIDTPNPHLTDNPNPVLLHLDLVSDGRSASSNELVRSAIPNTLPADLWEMLSFYPTNTTFEALASCIEGTLREDITSLQQTTTQLSAHLDTVESTTSATNTKIQVLKVQLAVVNPFLSRLQLQCGSLEDCSRLNNVCIQASQRLPQCLISTIRCGIFCQILGDTLPEDILIDGVNRAAATLYGPVSSL